MRSTEPQQKYAAIGFHNFIEDKTWNCSALALAKTKASYLAQNIRYWGVPGEGEICLRIQ